MNYNKKEGIITKDPEVKTNPADPNLESNPHWRTLQNPKFIGAHTLIDMGVKELEVEIIDVTRKLETRGDGTSQEATVLYFKDQKPLWLNVINQKTIQRVLQSPKVLDWVGKTITLYIEKVVDQDAPLSSIEDVWIDAIRVREFASRKEAEILNEEHPKFKNVCEGIRHKAVTIEAIKTKYNVDERVEKLLQNLV